MVQEAADINKSDKELWDAREFWWWAEKKRTSRLSYLRNAVWSKATKGSAWLPGVMLDLENMRWHTKIFKEASPSEPFIITRAKAVAAVLDNMPIFITDHSRLVGYPGSAPNLITWIPTASYLINEDLLNDRNDIIPEDSWEEAKEMVGFWKGRTFQDTVEQYQSKKEKTQKLMGRAGGTGRDLLGFDYVTPQPEWMYQGYDSIIKTIDENIANAEINTVEAPTAEEQVANMPKIVTWKAMKICLEAVIRYARRFSRLANLIAENFESDPDRKQELLQMSEICYKVPAQPPEHLWEAMQFDQFVQIGYRMEWHNAAWPWRQDYWHWPFYQKDVLEEKIMTRDEAIELCAEWMILAYSIGKSWARGGREAMQGSPGPYVWTLGGVDEEGNDACNDLTDCYLEAALISRVSDPTFGFRYSTKTRDKTLRLVFECIRHGLGYPSLRNDDVLIPNLMHWFGHPLKEARRWVHQACMAPAPDTKLGAPPIRYPSASVYGASGAVSAALNGGTGNLRQMMEQEGVEAPKFETFEDVYQAWLNETKQTFKWATSLEHRSRHVEALYYPKPMTSAIYERCVESGQNGALCKERSSLWYTLFSFSETGDCLAAIKKLVYEDKKYTLDQLRAAMGVNWDGYEDMRMDFVRAPKWGNDDDYVDQLYVRIYEDLAKLSWSVRDINNQPWAMLPESVATFSMIGALPALPNGRRQGDPLYDGGCSPGPGFDKKGPTAVLKSVSKLDHVASVRATLLNQRLSPRQLQGEKGFRLWSNYIKTWHDLGIGHVQFNMVDNETLYGAQKDAEKYSELIVRIAGYSAHFVEMNKMTQDAIIARNVQTLGK